MPDHKPAMTHASELATRSMRVLDGWWDPEVGLLWNPPGSLEPEAEANTLHLVPQSAWYAVGLLARGDDGDVEAACRTIDAVIATQYDAPGTVWHGTYARFAEWPEPSDGAVEWLDYDPNWREFIGTTFSLVLHRLATDLPAEVVERMEASTALARGGEPEGRIGAHYANIALMKAWLDADVGRRAGDESLVREGERFGAEVVERFQRHGAFDEYGSPTYYGIDLYALALWRTLPPTERFATWAAEIEPTLWQDIGRWYHAGLRNLCGPYSRSYGMDMGRYAGMLGLWLWPVLGPEAPFPDLETVSDHTHDLSIAPVAALLGVDVPADVLDHLREFRGERTVRQVISSEPSRVATGWLAPTVMAGGEDAEIGISAFGQYVPATVHWRLPAGGVDTIRFEHRGPLRATAGTGRLHVRADDHRHRGPQPTRAVIDVGDAPATLSADRWTLPGLTVEVEGPRDGVEVTAHDVTWPAGPVDLVLHLHADA